MSGSAACLKCPVCNTGGVFESSETLRDRLLFVSTHIVICPVCQEEVLGLGKLIGHLLTHVHLLKVSNRNDDYTTSDIKCTTEEYTRTEMQNDTKLTSKKCKSKNKIDTKEPLKYIKIFPKLPVVSMAAPGNSSVSMKMRANETKCNTDTICTLCGLQFVDSNVLKMHMCLIHNVEEDSNQNITKYQCHLCPKYFKMRGSLMVHLRVAHFGFCNQNSHQGDENGSGVSDKQINTKGDNKQWQCDVCRKYFTTKYFLKKHKRLHTGETPYSCTQCNKTFTFQQSYHKHLLYHNDEKPHCCNVCGRAFKELSTLHNHQRIHTGEKPFSCETCGKCFRQRVSYLVHRRIHTGVMPYKCTACEKSFRYKVSQRTHKCSAQPPGTVIRQSGDLVEKLKRKQTTHVPQSQKPTAVIEVSEENAELVRNGAKLSLEDTQSENFSIISAELADNSSGKKVGNSDALNNLSNEEYDTTHFDELINSIPTEDTNVPSPSEILKNLCLSHDNLNLMMM